jgi:hypothetical protein
MSVSPLIATVVSLDKKQFSATGFDQFGTTLATQAPFVWSVIHGTPGAGGTIDQSGLYTAGPTAGIDTVIAASGGVKASAPVTIIARANLLTNGDFSNDNDSWITQITPPAIGSVDYTTGVATVNISKIGAFNWHVQFYQLIAVTAGTVYTYSFSAKKFNLAGTRSITFVVETNGEPYTKDIERSVTINDTYQTFTGSFTASSSRSVRIEIQAGLNDLDFEADNFVIMHAAK